MRRLWFAGFAVVVLTGCGSEEKLPPKQEPTSSSTGGDEGGSGGGGGTGGTAGEGGATDPRFDALVQAIEAERAALGAPGVAVAVIEDGKVTFARGFGSKDPESDVPVEATTLFRIGSVNKMLTAAAMLHDVETGDVDLDAPITTYLPDFQLTQDATWAPSIHARELLTHSSGLYDYLLVEV